MVIRYNYSSSPSVYLSNNISGLKNANFVDTVLQDLLHRDLIVKCKKHLLFLSITVFSQSNKKKRFILDLRAVNEHLWKQNVKFEDMRTARQHIKLKSSMFAFDINLAYHHVDIYEPHTEILGFSWTVNGCISFL